MFVMPSPLENDPSAVEWIRMQKYTLIRSARRRQSASLSVTRDGEVVVRAPIRMPLFFIEQFVTGHTHWIEKRRKTLARPRKELVRIMSDKELKNLVEEYVSHYAARLAVKPTGFRYKQVTTYWGSCSPKGALSFNTKLAYTSKDAVEYVVVHELAHLRWRGHGKRFWALVKQTYEDTESVRAFLRQIPRE